MCQIIAEIGFNFLGDMALAERMIVEAAKAGATYAKFQTWSVKRLKLGAWDQDGRRELYEKAELSDQQHLDLMKMCQNNNIKFLTSVFSPVDAERVAQFTTEAIKIPSAEIANIPLLEKIVDVGFKTVYLSTGAATFAEISAAVRILGKDIQRKPFVFLLHCVSAYPCEFKNANLNRIRSLNEAFVNTLPGYSGHCFGIADALAALEYDVEVIEKHFTVDRDLSGRDNKFAILPHELEFLVNYVQQRKEMKKIHFSQYLSCEEDVRHNYRGRWDSV